MNHLRPLTVLSGALALSACASAPEGSYPSLAIRDAEYATGQVPLPTGDCADGAAPVGPRAEGQMQPAGPATPPPPPRSLSADLAERVMQLAEMARAANAEFEAAVPATRAAVRSRGGVGSKAWGRAEVAYADLRSIRSRTAIPLADLNVLVATREVAGEPVKEIVAARDAVARLIVQQDAVLSELAPR
ncbi:MAG: hypothetical protein GW855_00680 [Erythrobacter sp.]|nr:hypothetical protein [Erythrobacter sp.]NCQ64245.1 hypothetical protein [Alphaproteobacteria bacterium]